MHYLLRMILRFLLDEGGPTAVEYAFVLLLMFLAFLTAITALGQRSAACWQSNQETIQSAISH
ncbi:MAG TPA: Flp family type IVb pilin [Planctomycetaceae bacterium]|nr:Flp family type IVb pilin [Planctomycetaceae bacterium]HIQ22178.1 Flp family type IVb pilin [Planctomycetota bacterium]